MGTGRNSPLPSANLPGVRYRTRRGETPPCRGDLASAHLSDSLFVTTGLWGWACLPPGHGSLPPAACYQQPPPVAGNGFSKSGLPLPALWFPEFIDRGP